MAAAIPTSEPTSLRAGDTWSWSRSLADYPASSWTLAYSLINAQGKITVTAAASGADHLVTVPAATTAGYTPGSYSASARVTSGAESYSWELPDIEVLRNLSAETSYDDRSHARKVLDAIEAVLEGRASTDQQSVTIGDRAIVKMPVSDLLKLRDSYAGEVAGEERAKRIAAGMGGAARLHVRLMR